MVCSSWSLCSFNKKKTFYSLQRRKFCVLFQLWGHRQAISKAKPRLSTINFCWPEQMRLVMYLPARMKQWLGGSLWISLLAPSGFLETRTAKAMALCQGSTNTGWWRQWCSLLDAGCLLSVLLAFLVLRVRDVPTDGFQHGESSFVLFGALAVVNVKIWLDKTRANLNYR